MQVKKTVEFFLDVSFSGISQQFARSWSFLIYLYAVPAQLVVIIAGCVAISVLEGDIPYVVADKVRVRRGKIVTDGIAGQTPASHKDVHEICLSCRIVPYYGYLLTVLKTNVKGTVYFYDALHFFF